MYIKAFFWLITTSLETIFMLYHEMCHWIVGIIWFMLGYCDRPELRIDSVPKVYKNEFGGFTHLSASMSVWYSFYPNIMKSWMNKSITIAPAFGTILLILISPKYMVLLYIPYIHILWLSRTDIEKL